MPKINSFLVRTRRTAAQATHIHLLEAVRNFEKRRILRAFFDIGVLRGDVAVDDLDGEMQLLVNPKSFCLAAFWGELPFVAGASVDGFSTKFFTCGTLVASARITSLEHLFKFRHALCHGDVLVRA